MGLLARDMCSPLKCNRMEVISPILNVWGTGGAFLKGVLAFLQEYWLRGKDQIIWMFLDLDSEAWSTVQHIFQKTFLVDDSQSVET